MHQRRLVGMNGVKGGERKEGEGREGKGRKEGEGREGKEGREGEGKGRKGLFACLFICSHCDLLIV